MVAILLASTGATLQSGCRESPGEAVHLVGPQVAIDPGPYVPGQSYFGRNGYIEYVAGNAPVILSAPHGGALEPSEIPFRTAGACGGSATTTTDRNTIELALAVRDAFVDRFGTVPHVILNHLERNRLDANRAIEEAACGDPEAEIAWGEFHDFIEVAKAEVLATPGKGWYMDLHGHGHDIRRLELGYLLRGSQLDLSDATLDAASQYQDTSSIKTLSEFASGVTFSELLRGSLSLGTLYADNGIRAVPSSPEPGPEGNPYFRGGYNTVRHTCTVRASEHRGIPGGQICGVQVEAHYKGVRDRPAKRAAFGVATAIALEAFLGAHWGVWLGGEPPPPPPPAGIELQATGYKAKGKKIADLAWSGATSASVDVFRNGALVVTTVNDGTHTDESGQRGGGSFTYQVCEAATATCSNEATVF
jgi:hypothetical protein